MARILVADDDPHQLDLRKRLLEAGGHQVAIAFTPSEAFRQRDDADLILMDLRFPGAQGEPDAALGLALIRDLRAAGCRLPAIVLSGWPEDIEGRPEEAMVSRVLMKPVSMAELLAAIAELACWR